MTYMNLRYMSRTSQEQKDAIQAHALDITTALNSQHGEARMFGNMETFTYQMNNNTKINGKWVWGGYISNGKYTFEFVAIKHLGDMHFQMI